MNKLWFSSQVLTFPMFFFFFFFNFWKQFLACRKIASTVQRTFINIVTPIPLSVYFFKNTATILRNRITFCISLCVSVVFILKQFFSLALVFMTKAVWNIPASYFVEFPSIWDCLIFFLRIIFSLTHFLTGLSISEALT